MIPEAWHDIDFTTWRTLAIGAVGILVLFPISYVIKYRRSIRRRLLSIESQGVMVRETVKSRQKRKGRVIHCLELNPAFVEMHKEKWKLVGLGEYLTHLRPRLPGCDENGNSEDSANNSVLPKFIEHELDAAIGAILLKSLGKRFGGAILPLLGITNLDSATAAIATSIASWWASHFLVKEMEEMGKRESLFDAGSLPVNLGEVISMVNLNQKLVTSEMEVKPLEWMRRGEVGYSPTFGTPLPKETGSESKEDKTEDTSEDETTIMPDLIPNLFIISIHWDSAIEGMEKETIAATSVKAPAVPNDDIQETTGTTYDPDDQSLPEPTPINPRLLPDLYMGWGSAKCTHTKREIIRNRLLAVILNKLSYNVYKKEQDKTDFFAVKMKENSKEIKCPGDFLQALLDSGHTITMQPRATVTSFGISVCIKEKDESWSNVPIGIFLQSGYEREGDDRPAHYMMPHGGMDLHLTGPLVGKNTEGKDRNCDIQFYMAIDGLCAWHSDHNADVPWIQKTAFTKVYTNQQVVLAAKLASVLAVTFNALGTEMDLPYGGYGVLGVCNDTAALLDFGVRGETSMFPLVSTGRFLIRISRRLIQLHSRMKDINGPNSGDDIRRLIAASCMIQSDLQASPANLISSSKRFLMSQPDVLCFQLEQESKEIMADLKEAFMDFDKSVFQKFSIF